MSVFKTLLAGVSALILSSAVAQATPVQDDRLAAEVAAVIEKTPALQADGLHVEVVDGIVYLHGMVSSRMESLEAAQIAAQTPGVTRVVNQTALDR